MGENGRAYVAVLQHLALDGHDVRQQVAVRDHDALRFGRRAGREDHLRHIVARHGRVRHAGGVAPVESGERPHVEAGVCRAGSNRTSSPVRSTRPFTMRAHAAEEVHRGAVVDRHGDDALEQAAPERDDPLRAVLRPEEHRVALAQAGRVQPGGEGAGRAGDVGVGVGVAAEAAVVDEELASRGGEVGEEVEQGLAACHSHYHKWARCPRYLLRLPSARCTTRSCRTRCSSSSRAPRSRPSPSCPRRRTAGWRSSRPTIRAR